MNVTQRLTTQTKDCYSWINKLIDSIPFDKWEHTPDVLQTNVSWQVGHLVVSLYYHSILVITGHQADILRELPLKRYAELFTAGSPLTVVGQFDPVQLRKHLGLMQERSIMVIESLPAGRLDDALEPVLPAHPVAKNKFEALDWNIKHSMWHCGQLGLLKRVINVRMEFGLKI